MKRPGPLQGGKNVLWIIVGVFIMLWLLGFIGTVGGSLIHLLLVVALVILAVQLLTGRRSRRTS